MRLVPYQGMPFGQFLTPRIPIVRISKNDLPGVLLAPKNFGEVQPDGLVATGFRAYYKNHVRPRWLERLVGSPVPLAPPHREPSQAR